MNHPFLEYLESVDNDPLKMTSAGLRDLAPAMVKWYRFVRDNRCRDEEVKEYFNQVIEKTIRDYRAELIKDGVITSWDETPNIEPS